MITLRPYQSEAAEKIEAMVTKTLHYYPPHSVGGMKGVMWCADVPGREPVWSRQLCVAWKLSQRKPKSAKPKQLDLFA